MVEQPSVLTSDGLQVEIVSGESEPDGVEGLEPLKDRDAVTVRNGWDTPGEGERADVTVGGETVGGAGDVGGEGGHGDSVEAVAHRTPHVSEPALRLVAGEEGQQQLLSAAPVLVSAGVGQEVDQPVSHVRNTLLREADTQRGPAGRADLSADNADLADEVAVPAALHWRLSDRLQTDRTLQTALELRHQLLVGGQQLLVESLVVRGRVRHSRGRAGPGHHWGGAVTAATAGVARVPVRTPGLWLGRGRDGSGLLVQQTPLESLRYVRLVLAATLPAGG